MRHNLNRNDDGSYRITSTTKVGGTRLSRDRTIALSDCKVYNREGDLIRTIARTAKPNRSPKFSNHAPRTPVRSRRDLIDHALMSKMGSIHENDV